MSCSVNAAARYQQYLETVRVLAKEALAAVLAELGPSVDRYGGYISTKFVRDDRFLINQELVGEVRNGKDDKYREFSHEKAQRLEMNFYQLGHLSSFQSWKPEEDQWGGSIIGMDPYMGVEHIFSFSGLPELGDEAMMLYVAVSMDYLSLEDALKIAEVSNNDVFRRIVDKKVLKEEALQEEVPAD